MNRTRFLRWWSAAAGAMDAATGLMLMICPAWVLQVLRITALSADAMTYLGWIGVFVLSVGLAYGFAAAPRGCRARGEMVWILTSLVRTLVAVFVTAQVWSGALEATWLMVAAADAGVALLQWSVLRAGWWREVAR